MMECAPNDAGNKYIIIDKEPNVPKKNETTSHHLFFLFYQVSTTSSAHEILFGRFCDLLRITMLHHVWPFNVKIVYAKQLQNMNLTYLKKYH